MNDTPTEPGQYDMNGEAFILHGSMIKRGLGNHYFPSSFVGNHKMCHHTVVSKVRLNWQYTDSALLEPLTRMPSTESHTAEDDDDATFVFCHFFHRKRKIVKAAHGSP